MTDPMNREELHQLFGDFVNGTIGTDDLKRLEERLERDREARQLWYVYQDVQLGLRKWSVREKESAPVQGFARMLGSDAGARRASNGRLFRYAAAAALAVGVTLLLQWTMGGTSTPTMTRVDVPAQYVATLVAAKDAKWETDGRFYEGKRLLAGPFRLASGRAVFRFDGGASLILSAPAEIVMETAGRAALRLGKASVRISQEAHGFTLRTPASDFVDRGTEFAVTVEDSGATEVHVLEGEINSVRRSDTELLTAGQAVRFDAADASEGREIPLSAPRFSELMKPFDPGDLSEALIGMDAFDYGQPVMEATAANGGRGWARPWSGRFVKGDTLDPGQEIHIVPGESLEGPPSLAASSGGSMHLPLQRKWWLRTLETPIDLGSDAVYYVSFLVRKDGDVPSGRNTVFNITFRSSVPGEYFKHWLGFTITARNELNVFALGNNSTSVPYVRLGVTYLLVGKIVAGKESPDQLFLKAYDPDDEIDRVEPSRWSVTGRTFDDDARLDTLIVHNEGSVEYRFDELRIGRSWQSVTPRDR